MDSRPARLGVAGRGGGHGGPAGDDRLVQVGLVTGPLEPGVQDGAEVGQHRGAVGVAGRGGGHGVAADGDRFVQVGLAPGALEPGLQGGAEVGQPSRRGRGGRAGWRPRRRGRR